MSKLTQELEGVQASELEALMAKYVALVRRAYEPRPGDAARMAEILPALGKTAAHVDADVQALHDVAKFEAQVASMRQRTSGSREAGEAIEAAKRRVEEAQAALVAATKHYEHLGDVETTARHISQQAQEIRRRHAHLWNPRYQPADVPADGETGAGSNGAAAPAASPSKGSRLGRMFGQKR